MDAPSVRPANALTAALVDLLPMLERVRRLTPDGLVRLRIFVDRVNALAALPVGVLAGRTLAIDGDGETPADVTVGVGDLADVLSAVVDGEGDGDGPLALPPRRDAEWGHTPPPLDGWTHIAVLPDADVRAAVRAAALAVAAAPLPAAADLALDAPAFPNAEADAVAALDRRAPSGLVKMGFCPRGGEVRVDVAPRWTRLVGGYGSVYVHQNAGGGPAGAGGMNLLTMLG